MEQRKVVRTTKIQLLDKRTNKPVAEALVDLKTGDLFKNRTYYLDPRKNQAYRLSDDETRTTIYLHREVLGFEPGDGRTVKFRSSDHLDCTRKNLQEGTRRTFKKALRWPRKFERLVELLQGVDDEASAMLDEAEVRICNRTKLSVVLPAKYKAQESTLRKSLQRNFGFKGDLIVSYRTLKENGEVHQFPETKKTTTPPAATSTKTFKIPAPAPNTEVPGDFSFTMSYTPDGGFNFGFNVPTQALESIINTIQNNQNSSRLAS